VLTISVTQPDTIGAIRRLTVVKKKRRLDVRLGIGCREPHSKRPTATCAGID
jgi:hypothetical protein